MIKTVINVTAPRQQVFSVLSDYPNYRQWVPGCEKCVVLSTSGDTSETEIVISRMKRIELGVRFEAQPGQALSFRMTKGKELRAYSGTYRLMDSADGSGTVVIAELEIDVGSMVPRFVADKMTRKMLDDTGAALCNYIARAPVPAFTHAATAKDAAPAKRCRPRKILRVTRTASGYHVWLMGETFAVKNLEG